MPTLNTLVHFILVSAATGFVSASMYADDPPLILKRAARVFLYLIGGVASFSILVQLLGWAFL